MQHKRWKYLIRTVAFLLVFAVAFFAVQSPFGFNQSFAYLNSKGFPKEKKGGLDGIYIGASNVHAFWQPLIGWADYGIAVYNYSFDALPAGAVKHLIEVARKRQPDALYMVNLNQFKNAAEDIEHIVTVLHRCLDYMPVSVERFRCIAGLSKTYGLNVAQQLELMFPIITFHARWNELKSWAMGGEANDFKSSRSKAIFLTGRQDCSDKYTVEAARLPREEAETSVLIDLLDYIDRTGVRVLFIKAPQAMGSGTQQYMNTLQDIVVERGYPCLDLHESLEQTGLDPAWDFYNPNHTNIHGSAKYTRCLAEYLVENYGFTDKRNAPGWESWNEAREKYYNLLGGYLLPFELGGVPRAKLEAPVLGKAAVEAQDIAVSWSAVEGADGYQIYRKGGEGGNRWKPVGDVDGQTLSWRDAGRKPATAYTYTVVGYLRDGDALRYGSFDQTGVTAKTEKAKKAADDAPEASDEEDESAGGDEE